MKKKSLQYELLFCFSNQMLSLPDSQKLSTIQKYSLLALCLISFRFQNPSNFDTVSKTKAVFIYGFTRYFEWTDDKKTGSFIIYVIGKNDNLVSELKKLAGQKKVGAQDIEVRNSTAIDPSINCHIAYFVPDPNHAPVLETASKMKGKGCLIIAESPGAAKSGGAINFFFVDGKLKFEYNKSSAVKAGLKTNEDFKGLAAVNID